MDDQQLVWYKQDSRSRPSWKTIGQRLRRTPESCRAQIWFQMTLLLRSNLLVLSLLENFPCCLLLLWGFYLSLFLLHPVSSLHFSISFGSWLLRFRFQAMIALDLEILLFVAHVIYKMAQWPLIDPFRSSIVVDQYSWWLHTMIFDAWPKTKLDRVPWLTIGQIFFRGWKPVWTAVHLFEVGGTTETTKHLVSNILHDLSDHISVVWDFQLDPEDLCLRYSDLTGDAVDFDSLYLVLGGVQAFRPEWCRIRWWLQLLPLHGLHPALNHEFYASSERSCRHSTEALHSLSRKSFWNFPVMACFCLHSSRLSHSPYRYGLSLFRFQFCNFWLSLFTMTKRDSLLADLPSLRDLRMASEQELHTPMEPVSKLRRWPLPSLCQLRMMLPPSRLHIWVAIYEQPTQLLSRSSSTATKILSWLLKKSTARDTWRSKHLRPYSTALQVMFEMSRATCG